MSTATKAMPTTRVKSVEPIQWVRQIVAQHRKNSPYLNMQMAIWMNPTNDPLNALLNGIELVEICENAAFDNESEFRPIRFSPSWGMPGLILTVTSPATLNFDLEINRRRSFFSKLKNKLENGKAIAIFPMSKRNPVETLEGILGQVEADC